MIGKDVGGNRVISIHDVVDILEQRKALRELTYEQQIALEHAKKFFVGKEKSEKVRKALEVLGNLNERSVIKILEVMPKNPMTLKQILAQEGKSFTDEDVNKILAITKEKG